MSDPLRSLRRFDILKALQSCPLAELICNHRCFAQTIENLFTLSFLV